METKPIRTVSLLLLFVGGTISQLFPVQPSSHEFYVTEFVRVKRQAGYVYNKPSTPFNLPSRPSNTPTQTTNVDRTQEQHMYYAYPVPSGETVPKPGYPSGAPGPAANSASGYNYETPSNAKAPESSVSGSSFNNALTSSAPSDPEYNYNSPRNSASSGQTTTTASSSTATSSVSVGYGYGAPSLSYTGQTDSGPSSQSGNNVNAQANSVQVSEGLVSTGYVTPSVSSRQSLSQTDSGYKETAMNSITNGYGYDAPSSSSSKLQSNPNIVNTFTESLQTPARTNSLGTSINAISSSYGYPVLTARDQSIKTTGSSTATSSVSTNYNYDPPAFTNQESIVTSTSAPQYLPPIGGEDSGVSVTARDKYESGDNNNNYGFSGNTTGYGKLSGSKSSSGGIDGGTTGYPKEVSTGVGNNFVNTFGSAGVINAIKPIPSYNSGSGSGGYASVNDKFSKGGTGYNTVRDGLNAESVEPVQLTNTYIPPSSAIDNPPPLPSQSYLPSEDLSSSSRSTSVGAISTQVSQKSSTYIPPPTSLNLSAKQSIPPSQTYLAASNSRTGPAYPSQTYTSNIKSSTISRSEMAIPSVGQPSPTYIPQTTGPTSSVFIPPSGTYIASIRPPRPASPPSQTYIPQSSEPTPPAPGVPSLNYKSPSTRPSSETQSTDRVSLPNANYIPPNVSSGQFVPRSNSGPLQPSANYLPPPLNSLPKQQSLPASYLPPVF